MNLIKQCILCILLEDGMLEQLGGADSCSAINNNTNCKANSKQHDICQPFSSYHLLRLPNRTDAYVLSIWWSSTHAIYELDYTQIYRLSNKFCHLT